MDSGWRIRNPWRLGGDLNGSAAGTDFSHSGGGEGEEMGSSRRLLQWLPQPSRSAPLDSLGRPFFLRTLRLFSSPPAPPQPQPPPSEPVRPNFMVEYLVRSCGLSSPEACRASRYFTHLKSSKKPDAVLRHLREQGLEPPHIRRLVLSHPRVLLASVKKTLEPKIRVLRAAGFSGPELARLISASRATLELCNVVPRVEFWKKLIGSDQKLFKTMERAPHLLSYRPEERVLPSLSLLRSLGLPEDKIATVILRRPRLVVSHPDKIRAVVEQAKSLGAAPGMRLFAEALSTVANLSAATLDAKSRLLRGFGWSQEELCFAFQRFPHVLRFSEKKLLSGMDFLLKEASCEPSYVARHPVLLGFSVEKRLMPRFQILQFLKMKGLPGTNVDLCTAMAMPEKKFQDKFFLPNREEFSEIFETYFAACGEKPSR